MKVVLRQKKRATADSPVRESVIDCQQVRIGRGSDQEIHLPGLSVALQHAVVEAMPHGFEITAASSSGFVLNGQSKTHGVIGAGDVIEIGGHQLLVTSAMRHSGLGFELTPPGADEVLPEKTPRLTIESSQPPVRRWAWWLFGLSCLFGLSLPWMISHWNLSAPWLLKDMIWNTGPLSAGHAELRNDCRACHEEWFVPVQTSACLGCHQSTSVHASPWPSDELDESHSDMACTHCHREHNGTQGMTAEHPDLCRNCHENPDLYEMESQAASDFSNHHPEFSPVSSETGQLHFSHAAHLEPLRGPQGTQTLACSDCHQPNASQSGFLPIHMPTHCADCHRLGFDPEMPEKQLPHGHVSRALEVIQDHYARKALSGSSNNQADPAIVRRRPGTSTQSPRVLTEAQRVVAMRWARQKAETVADEVFGKRACGLCHVAEKTPTGWRLDGPQIPHHWMQGATFPHDDHEALQCSDCHSAATSDKAQDSLMPNRESCLTCHAGRDSKTLIPTTCIDCHSFHRVPSPWPQP